MYIFKIIMFGNWLKVSVSYIQNLIAFQEKFCPSFGHKLPTKTINDFILRTFIHIIDMFMVKINEDIFDNFTDRQIFRTTFNNVSCEN